MRIIHPLFAFFLLSFNAMAQEREAAIAQLQTEIAQATSDSIRIPLELRYSEHLALYDVEQAREVNRSVLQKIKDKGYESRHFKVQLATAYVNLGAFESSSSKGLNSILEGLKIFEKIQDSVGLGYTYLNLATFNDMLDSTKLKKYTRKSITIFQALGQKRSYELATAYTKLGHFYNLYKQKDSALYFYEKSKQVNDSSATLITNNMAIGTLYYKDKQFDKAFPIYKETIELAKKSSNYRTIGGAFMTQAAMYAESKAYDKALAQIDSSIVYAKYIKDINRLQSRYNSRHSVNERKGDFKSALKDYKTSRIYLDSITNIDEVKRFTEVELKYEFEKEKQIAAIRLANANSKKQLYIILFIVAIILGLVFIYFILRNKKQKIALAQNQMELEQMEKVKTKLALANRESELKKVLIESSITEEVLNKTLDDIKDIIVADNENERQTGLRSLSATLLSEKTTQKTTLTLQEYLDQVSLDFKVHLDTNFPMLLDGEKELLYLMKAGLNAPQIGKLKSTSLSSVKSMRSRIRKKLELGSREDIIAHLVGVQ